MPRIAEFYGIAIYMYHREHGVPHFHALYGEMKRSSRSAVCASWRDSYRGALLRSSGPGASYMEKSWSATGNWRGAGAHCDRSRHWRKGEVKK